MFLMKTEDRGNDENEFLIHHSLDKKTPANHTPVE
ncbi:Uncharacterised protein [Actinobacillus pleuropneumoniae]|nr:Uncharacterised protein [Actinobacillus pleuropneumoniae]